MNILFLTAWYPVSNTPHKGIFIQEHAKAIAAQGHNVCVIALDVSAGKSVYTESASRYRDEYGLDTHVISVHSRWHKKLYALYPLLERIVTRYVLKHITPSFNPDIVHSNVLYPAALLGDTLSTHFKVPHIITEHWSKSTHFLNTHPYRSRGKLAYTNADAITFVSDFLKKEVSPYLDPVTTVKVVPNIVDDQTFMYCAKSSASAVRFVAAATWTPPKRPDLIVHALQRIAAQSAKPIELHMFGEGILLDNLVSEEPGANFCLIRHGFRSKQEIARQLHESHYMLHASEIETFSIVVAEALCTGTPVIASKRGALPELVNELNGILCDNTAEAWASAIDEALGRNFDHLAISGQVRDKCSPKAIGAAFSALYTSVLSPTT